MLRQVPAFNEFTEVLLQGVAACTGQLMASAMVMRPCSRANPTRTEVTLADKRQRIEPVLLPVSEQLKRALCDRLRAHPVPGPGAGVVEVVSAGDHRIELGDRELFLCDARLDQATFEKLLRPLLNPHTDRNLSDEYVERDSVFRPIHQLLARAGLPPEAVDLVVLAGSSP